MTIYKYDLAITDEQTIETPRGATPFFVAMQHGVLRVWARVSSNPNQPKEPRTFRVIGTGNPFNDAPECRWIGTVFDGPFVWHVFEKETQ